LTVDRSQLADFVRDTVADVLGLAPADLTGSTDLLADLEVDSLELMTIGSRLEAALDVRLDVEQVTGITTLDQAVHLVMAATSGRV
jgi:acyl carrier protein